MQLINTFTLISVAVMGTTALPSCEKGCPKIYQPVCGSNGITYSNECLFSIAQCKDQSLSKSFNGTCPEACDKPCTKILRPVCGSDGVT
ncbi:hypothetical protein HDU97_002946, partial [Phlyctochytrium planicorne]